MPGPIRASNTRLTFILSRVRRAWLDTEAGRLRRFGGVFADVGASNCVRAAVEHFAMQSDEIRRAIVAAYGHSDAEAGTDPPTQRV
jgi:hypothetical protein